MFKDSGLVTGKMKPLKYEAIPGLLTKEQVTPHYQAHYGGALKRFTTIEQQLDGLYQGKDPLGGDALTFIHKDKVNRMNSVFLHELYFDGLTPTPGDPAESIRTALAKRFGSLDRWIEDFKVCCMAAMAGEYWCGMSSMAGCTTSQATCMKLASSGSGSRSSSAMFTSMRSMSIT